jgi:CRISPR-associated protein Csm3
MKLKNIKEIKGKIYIKTGLHIGAGNDEIKIGGIDNPVVKNPLTNEPYIPGSSLKGKIRSLIEWQYDLSNNGEPVDVQNNNSKIAKKVVKLFGNGKTIRDNTLAKEIGPTRVSFADCYLEEENKEKLLEKNALTEEKIEVKIDRLSGTVGRGGPRHMERVPAGAIFNFSITLLEFEEDKDLEAILALGMKLLELTNLGGSGSRGYGKIEFEIEEGLSEKFLNGKKLKGYKELSKIGN